MSVSKKYSGLSVALHWLAAVAVVALFISHEGGSGSAMQSFHVGGGAIFGLLLMWRVIRRPVRGFTEKPAQPAFLNLVSSVVLWGLLLSILAVTITGYLLPWTAGRPLDIFGVVSIPSFMVSAPALHNAIESMHNFTGHVIVPLTLLHVLGALKHWVIDRDGVMQRMFRSQAGGK